MATDEELVRERITRDLGLTELDEAAAMAPTCAREELIREIRTARYADLGRRYVEALVDLELEVGGLVENPAQSEYVLGVTTALDILRGRLRS